MFELASKVLFSFLFANMTANKHQQN